VGTAAIVKGAHDRLRRRKAKVKVERIHIREGKPRKKISSAKMDFLAAVQNVIAALREYWPLSLRQIHYALFSNVAGDPPLIHGSKPDSTYRGDKRSYDALKDLVTRARHEGSISYEVIDDPTRPVMTWDVHPNLSSYYEYEMEEILNDYLRDLMQSQPHHIEIIAEKNTLQNVLNPVAWKYRIPITFGRGQNTTRPLYNIARRYKESGKDKLILLIASDLDPDGDAIAHSNAQRLRDDHGIYNVEAIRVALTFDQVRRLKLPESFERAKKDSKNYKRYHEEHPNDFVWELEALAPKVLQQLLANATQSVIDKKAFNAEVSHERLDDAPYNAAVREKVLATLRREINKARGR
jgi:hypothetical protein